MNGKISERTKQYIEQETEDARERTDNAIDAALEAVDYNDPNTQCKLLLDTVLALRGEVKLLRLRLDNLEAYNYH